MCYVYLRLGQDSKFDILTWCLDKDNKFSLKFETPDENLCYPNAVIGWSPDFKAMYNSYLEYIPKANLGDIDTTEIVSMEVTINYVEGKLSFL